MSTHGPRPSILNLFDPLNTDLDASPPSRDLLSPDADKENTPVNRFHGNLNDNELTLTAFFNRTYSKKIPQKPIPNPVLRRRLVDVGDVTVIQEESADAEAGDDETAGFNLNETDDEYGDNDETPSDTPRPRQMIAKQPSPRTPLGELPLDHTRTDVFFTPVARKKVKPLMRDAQTRLDAPPPTINEVESTKESQDLQEEPEEDETISIAHVLNNSPHQVDILRGVPSPIVAPAEGGQTSSSALELAEEEDEFPEPQPKLDVQSPLSTPAIIISVSPSPVESDATQIHSDEPEHAVQCNVDVVTESQSHPLPSSMTLQVHSPPTTTPLLSPSTVPRSKLLLSPSNAASLSLSSSFKLKDSSESFDIRNAKISCSYGSSYGGGRDSLTVSTLKERRQSDTLAPPAFDRKKRSERANARDSVDLSSSFQISDLGKDGSFDLLNDKISFFSSRSRGSRSLLDDEDDLGNGSFDLQEEEDRMDFLVGSMVNRPGEKDEKDEKLKVEKNKDEDDLSSSPVIEAPSSPIGIPPASPVVADPSASLPPQHSVEPSTPQKNEITVKSPIIPQMPASQSPSFASTASTSNPNLETNLDATLPSPVFVAPPPVIPAPIPVPGLRIVKRAKAPAAPAPIAPLHSRQTSRPSVPRSSNIGLEARPAAAATVRPNRMAMRSVVPPSSSSGSSAPTAIVNRITVGGGGPRRVPLTDSHPVAIKQSQPAVPVITARRVPVSNPAPVVKSGAGTSRVVSKMPGPSTHAPTHAKVTGIGKAPARTTGPANPGPNVNRPTSRIPSANANGTGAIASGIKPPVKYNTQTQTSGIQRPTSRLPALASAASAAGSRIRMPGTSTAGTGVSRGIPVPTRRAL